MQQQHRLGGARCSHLVVASARPVRSLPRRPPYQAQPGVQQARTNGVQQQQQLLRGGASIAAPLQRLSQAESQQGLFVQEPPQQQQEGQAQLSREILTLVLLSTAVSFICSIDRAAMSVTILPMGEEFHWDDSVKGAVSSAFFAGYMITNLCGGYLATRFSSKDVLALGVVMWSLFTIATPTAAASGSVGTLLFARAAMGVGEGVTYPSIQNLVRRWVPDEHRSRALSFIYSGHQLGTIASYLLAPLLIQQLGWPAVFWIFGSLGFVWCTGWLPLVRNEPTAAAALPAGGSSAAAAARAVAKAPAALADAARQEPALKLGDIPWGSFMRNKAFWAIVAAQVSSSVGSCLAFSWLPTFYNEAYAVDVMQSSAYTIIPFMATVAATNASGWIADGLVNNKVLDKTTTRKLMQAIASFGPPVVLLRLAADQGASGANSITEAVAMITCWLALTGFNASGHGSNHQDISSKYTGILYGLSNGLASVAGSVSIYLTGLVLHSTHDWGLIFEAAAASYALGALVYLKWASCQEQFGEGSAAGR